MTLGTSLSLPWPQCAPLRNGSDTPTRGGAGVGSRRVGRYKGEGQSAGPQSGPAEPPHPGDGRPEGAREPRIRAQRHWRHEEKQKGEQCAQWKLVATEALGARLPARAVGSSLGHSPSLPLSQRKGRGWYQPCMLYQLVTRNTRQKAANTPIPPQTASPTAQMESSSLALGECS